MSSSLHASKRTRSNSTCVGCFGCRSDLANADEDKTDEKDDDFVKGFKVANFEIIDSPDKGEPHSTRHCTDCPYPPCYQQHFDLITNSY